MDIFLRVTVLVDFAWKQIRAGDDISCVFIGEFGLMANYDISHICENHENYSREDYISLRYSFLIFTLILFFNDMIGCYVCF